MSVAALKQQLEAFKNDVDPARWPSSGAGTGALAIVLLSFAQLEGLAGAAFGRVDPTTDNCVKFIRTYFRAEYHQPARLLYWMYRHGVVHQFSPKIAKVGTTLLAWMITRGATRHRHLKLIPGGLGPDVRYTYLNIETDLLIADTRAAGDALVAACERYPAVLEKVERALQMRNQAQKFGDDPVLDTWIQTAGNWLQ